MKQRRPNAVEDRDEEKYFKVGKRTSEVIDTYLVQGKNIPMIQRTGADKEAYLRLLLSDPILVPFFAITENAMNCSIHFIL